MVKSLTSEDETRFLRPGLYTHMTQGPKIHGRFIYPIVGATFTVAHQRRYNPGTVYYPHREVQTWAGASPAPTGWIREISPLCLV